MIMRRKKRRNEENYNFSPWQQFGRITLVVLTLSAIAAIYALAATLL